MDGVIITTPKHLSDASNVQLGHVHGTPSPSRRQAVPHELLGLKTPRNESPSRDSPVDRSSRSQGHLLTSPPSNSTEEQNHSLISTSPHKFASSFQRPKSLPSHLISHFHSQKQTLLHALQNPPLVKYEHSPYYAVHDLLAELLRGTMERNEGNSCLILGPRGSGKTRALASVCSSCAIAPVVVRLSAYNQISERLAMQEIARQIHAQLGPSVVLPGVDGETENGEAGNDVDDLLLPPSTHLPAMIAALPGLGRPIIIILDAFDGFAGHPRQSLLYCLLDTVQSCRGGSTSMAQGERHGLLVVGLTSRIDCLTLLEKRVKSRFSHRIMRVGTPSTFDVYLNILKTILNTRPVTGEVVSEEWEELWSISVQDFISDKATINIFRETFAFGKDLRVLLRLLISPVISLTRSSPWLKASQLSASVSVQRCSRQFSFLTTLPYPHVALLIAAAHTQTSGHHTVNFEILYDKFINQVRISASAPIQSEKGGLGMAFEELAAHHLFRPVAAPSTHVTKEFVKYRCLVGREDIKRVVEQVGQTNLKKWYFKNQ
ncbi:origin recognition complex subunit 4 C-terminus-domain-containing protein [Hysterangium stoloniferum]|nr:origin recognition complex subunit 4 C-terminus-domain-containing protein [Hysterangium stoloniferum]